ncbi:hypothetical protein [Planobispora longispora]|uniref:Uncharacterized protein n=1 Tax=Planobispora longispora TaxID=28887 RepID=A0A8J3RQP3_9ACTN|nr:hypothetical protein [Planobispora longispora]GIH79424.1 hypothetical protein Plo01_58530 [Planobispora longispora]
MNELEVLEKMRSRIPLRDPDELARAVGWEPPTRHIARTPRGVRRRLPGLIGTMRAGTAWRVAAGAAVLVGAVMAAVLGPSLVPGGAAGAKSYASAAIDIVQEGGNWVARIKDPLAEHERYREGFESLGLDVTLELVPASPSLVGQPVVPMFHPGAPGPSGPAGEFSAGVEPEGCTPGALGCHLAFRIPVGFTGEVRAQLGRPARPGEPYQTGAAATAEGEALEGVTVSGRTVAQVLADVRERGLDVVYRRVRADPDAPTVNFLDGKSRQAFHLSYEPVSADAVGQDWLVWEARAHSGRTVVLEVTPTPLEPIGSS